MKFLKAIGKIIAVLIALPILYFLIASILTLITVNKEQKTQHKNQVIYLNTNGVHLDMIFPVELLSPEVLKDLKYDENVEHLSFGWGDENFYLNTPEWKDLTIKNATNALFLESSTLIHLTKYPVKNPNWTEVEVSSLQLQKLNHYLKNSFYLNAQSKKEILDGESYSSKDDFYKANGNYTCFFTCNTWVNSAFKNADLKACLWTPFDFGLLDKYQN